MVALKGHFDGRLVAPDEPVNLSANQRVLFQIQPINEQSNDFRVRLGQANAAPLNPVHRFNSDDNLWTVSPMPWREPNGVRY